MTSSLSDAKIRLRKAVIKDHSTLLDLTHPLTPEIPTWDLDCGFRLGIDMDYGDFDGPDKFRSQNIAGRAGIGTHIDAPAHLIQNAATVDALALENLIVNCVVMRVAADIDEKYVVMPEVVQTFEQEHGKIQPGTLVIFHTGWGRHWGTPERYQNNLQFPSVHEETAKLLLDRSIVGLGTDTLSSDSGGKLFPVHRLVLGAGKYLIENVAQSDALPPVGAKVLVMPMKIKHGTEAPIRLVAVVG